MCEVLSRYGGIDRLRTRRGEQVVGPRDDTPVATPSGDGTRPRISGADHLVHDPG